MTGSNVHATGDMITRLETELREKRTFVNEVAARAQSGDRDLTENERELLTDARSRMVALKEQLDDLESVSKVTYESEQRARQVGQAIEQMRGDAKKSPVEYRSAGAYALDLWRSANGSRDALDRLEIFSRAADHIRSTDEAGLIPDPIVGPVINFIDAARPIVRTLGVKPLQFETFYRPRVTQHTAVALQGTAGAAADEKTELVSQKMVITRLTGNAKTYGGYVNLSKQVIDFSQPGVLDAVINDLAAQYSIDTEAATAQALATTTTTAVGYGATPTGASINNAVWKAIATVYNAVKGQGQLVIAASPDTLPVLAQQFAPYGPFNQFGQGFEANRFGQGQMGVISGVPTVMSAGLSTGQAFLYSTAALEAYEQRIGTLQVVEPSVLGLQVAYAGYYATIKIIDGGIVPLTAT